MKIEELWRELEAEPKGAAEWTARLALPSPGYPVLVALERGTGSRVMLIPASLEALPPRREWPVCHGLELIAVQVGREAHVGVRLRDPSATEVFTALAEDVARRVAPAQDQTEAAGRLFERLQLWQLFLATARDGLSIEAQRGLFGEVHFLSKVLIPRFGVRMAVEAWKAAAAAHQDFQFSTGAVEIKTTAAKQPQCIRITSERQLDSIGAGQLFLHVIVVDDREVLEVDSGTGESLATAVAAVRKQAANVPVVLGALDDRLLRGGWLEAQAARYEGRRLTVRHEHTFQVREGFPRISEADLPLGVGAVAYSLDIAACAAFVVDCDKMLGALTPSQGS